MCCTAACIPHDLFLDSRAAMLEDAARRSELDSYLVEAGSMIPEAVGSTSAGGLLSFPPEILLHIRACSPMSRS